jgi:hypothetical protein
VKWDLQEVADVSQSRLDEERRKVRIFPGGQRKLCVVFGAIW